MSLEFQVVIVAALVGLVIWIIKQFLQNYTKNYFTSKMDLTYGTVIEVQRKLELHLDECDELPKKVIEEKLDALKEDFKEFKEDVKKENIFQHERFHELAINIQNLTKIVYEKRN